MGWDKWSDTVEKCDYLSEEDKLRLLDKHKQDQIEQKLIEKYKTKLNKKNSQK